jgi:hypothetical protein
MLTAVFHMFSELPDPDPSVRDMDPDPDPDPSAILLLSSKYSKKNLDFFCFVASFGLFIFEKLCKCTFNKYLAEKLFYTNYYLLAS